MDPRYAVLADAARLGRGFVDGLGERSVGATASIAELRARLGRPLTDAGEDARAVIAELAADVEPGLIASTGPRYFGCVIGGALPVAVAADWLTSAWDQNTGGTVAAPALAVAEAVAADWVRELLGLPASCGVGFVTGCQMAHVTCLAAARHAVLADAGWGVESTPEFSRRARGVPLYAALRSLGRDGVADLVDRCCDLAQRIAQRLAEDDAVEILNDVVLNQVLVRFAGSDEVTDAVIERVQSDGTCWAGGSRWRGAVVMRISVSGWQTTTADADRSADAILSALRAVRRAAAGAT